MILALGWSDFSLKYRGSLLGYLWSFLGPLAQFLVIYHVFKPFVASALPHYPLYLFLGLILWEHFAMTTSGCMSVLFDKEGIIQKMAVPRFLLIGALGWQNLLIFLTRLLVFALLALLLGVSLPWSIAFVPLLLVQMTALALGVGMLFGSYVLRYRDLQHLWGIGLNVLFWLTPITYPYTAAAPLLEDLRILVAGGFSWGAALSAFIRFQPLSLLLHESRRWLLYAEFLGVPSFLHVLGFTLVCLLVFVGGFCVFQCRSRFFVEEY